MYILKHAVIDAVKSSPLAGSEEVAKAESESIDLGEVSGPEGHWVVVVKGKVVATSEDAYEMLELAEKYPPEDVVVTKILYPGASFY
jgi:hypothetical protein